MWQEPSVSAVDFQPLLRFLHVAPRDTALLVPFRLEQSRARAGHWLLQPCVCSIPPSHISLPGTWVMGKGGRGGDHMGQHSFLGSQWGALSRGSSPRHES